MEAIRQQIVLTDPANRGGFCAAVLLETFVEVPRFAGTYYWAADWHYLGETQGRSQCDLHYRAALVRKAVCMYLLAADFRQALKVAA